MHIFYTYWQIFIKLSHNVQKGDLHSLPIQDKDKSIATATVVVMVTLIWVHCLWRFTLKLFLDFNLFRIVSISHYSFHGYQHISDPNKTQDWKPIFACSMRIYCSDKIVVICWMPHILSVLGKHGIVQE